MMIRFMDALTYDNEIIFLNSNGRHLFAIDEGFKKVRYAGYISSNWTNSPIRKIFLHNDELYMVSFAGLIIYKCTKSNGFFEGEVFFHDDTKTNIRVADAFYFEGKIFIFPYNVDQAIFCYDISNNKIIYSVNYCICCGIDPKAMLSDVHLYDRNIYFSVRNNNVLFKFDIDTRDLTPYVHSSIKIGGFCITEEGILLRQADGYSVEKYNEETGCCNFVTKQYDALAVDGQETKGKIIYSEGSIILLPGTSNKIGFIDKDGKVHVIDLTSDIKPDESLLKSNFSFGGMRIGRYYYFFPWRNGTFVRINAQNNTYDLFDLDYKGNIEMDLKKTRMKTQGIADESLNMTLNDYIEYL